MYNGFVFNAVVVFLVTLSYKNNPFCPIPSSGILILVIQRFLYGQLFLIDSYLFISYVFFSSVFVSYINRFFCSIS